MVLTPLAYKGAGQWYLAHGPAPHIIASITDCCSVRTFPTFLSLSSVEDHLGGSGTDSHRCLATVGSEGITVVMDSPSVSMDSHRTILFRSSAFWSSVWSTSHPLPPHRRPSLTQSLWGNWGRTDLRVCIVSYPLSMWIVSYPLSRHWCAFTSQCLIFQPQNVTPRDDLQPTRVQ